MKFTPFSYPARGTLCLIKRDVANFIKRRSKDEKASIKSRLQLIPVSSATVAVTATTSAGIISKKVRGRKKGIEQLKSTLVSVSNRSYPTVLEHTSNADHDTLHQCAGGDALSLRNNISSDTLDIGIKRPNVTEQQVVQTSTATTSTVPVSDAATIATTFTDIGIQEPSAIEQQVAKTSTSPKSTAPATKATTIATPITDTSFHKSGSNGSEEAAHSSFSFGERKSFHMIKPSVSTVATTSDNTTRTVSTAYTVASSATSYSDINGHNDDKVATPPLPNNGEEIVPAFPYDEAVAAVDHWYKTRPRATEDRHVLRGVTKVLNAAFHWTPHNPELNKILSYDFDLAQYQFCNFYLLGLFCTLHGNRLEAIHAVERLLATIYPDVYVHQLLHDFGHPGVKTDDDELRHKICAFLMPEYSEYLHKITPTSEFGA
jgi:hypothetical protein